VITPEKNRTSFRPSLVFLILAGIAVIIFGAVMMQIVSINAPYAKVEAQTAVVRLKQLELAAERIGISVKELKRQREQQAADRKEVGRVINALFNSIDEHDQPTLNQAAREYRELLDDKRKREMMQPRDEILAQVIARNSPPALRALIDAGVPCDSESGPGRNGLHAALNSDDDTYLKIFIGAECSLHSNRRESSVFERIARSKFPERLLLFPRNDERATKQFDYAFASVVSRGDEESALTLLKGGANPNAINRQVQGSPLYQAVIRELPVLALALIEYGADVNYRLNDRQPILERAIHFGQVAVAKEIVKREPDYIKRESAWTDYVQSALGAGTDYLQSALNVSLASERLTLVTLVHEHGGSKSTNTNRTFRWLRSAIAHKDHKLVVQLLGYKISPRVQNGKQTPLGYAKQLRDANKENAGFEVLSQIVVALKQFGATDDALLLYREAKKTQLDPSCSVGSVIVYAAEKLAIGGPKLRERQTAVAADSLRMPPSDVITKERNSRFCLGAIATCANQGHGFDDCSQSVERCDTLAQLVGKLCCTQGDRDEYREARCSGMNVDEAVLWMSQP